MENILAKIALAFATLTASFIAFFTGTAPVPATPALTPEVVIAVPAETTDPEPRVVTPKATPAPVTTVMAPNPSLNAYEIGKQVGYLQALTERAEEEAKKPPEKDEPADLPDSEEEPMNEEEPKAAEAPVSQAKIELFSEDKATGLGRTYNAVTDPAVERWDQASDYSNFVVINFIAYNEEGKKESHADVKVTATDSSQSKQLGGKQEYQYLFKTPGEHTITFEAYGVSKSVTLTAN